MKPNQLSTVAVLAPLAGGEANAIAATAAWWKNFHDAELDSSSARATGRSIYQAQDALVQSDRTISANLIALYKSPGGYWETLEPQLVQAKTMK